MVIVGEPGDDPLLGATPLEGFGLVLDPFRRELRAHAASSQGDPPFIAFPLICSTTAACVQH